MILALLQALFNVLLRVNVDYSDAGWRQIATIGRYCRKIAGFKRELFKRLTFNQLNS